jgi:hypothetical protein
MSIDRQGKGTGEGAVERITSRPAENKPSDKTTKSTREKVEDVLKGKK